MSGSLRIITAVALLAAVPAGCATPGGGADAGAPAPASAQAGETTIVAIQPSAPQFSLFQFLGINDISQAVHGLSAQIHDVLSTLFPPLAEAIALSPLHGPTDLIPAPEDVPADAPPAVGAAAQLAADEQAAQQTVVAIKKLAQYGCIQGYPQIEEAFLAALNDPFEFVRFETTKALADTAGHPCKVCKSGACCTPELREKLMSLAFEEDVTGCPVESSPRVRRMARLALGRCGPPPPIIGAPPPPIEGPAPPPPDVPPPPIEGPGASRLIDAASTAATADVVQHVAESQIEADGSSEGDQPPQTGGVAAARPIAAKAAPVSPPLVPRAESDSRGESTADGTRFVRQAGMAGNVPSAAKEAIVDITQASTADALTIPVRWELITAPTSRFTARDDARLVVEYYRSRALGQPATRPPDVLLRKAASESFDWTRPQQLRSTRLAAALSRLAVGHVSEVIEDDFGFHVIRVLERQPQPAAGLPSEGSP